MNEKLPYWGSVFFSAAALVLLVINVSLSNANRATQMDVNKRQAELNMGPQLTQINQGMVQLMAQAALKNGDTQMRDLLASQGITLKNEPAKASDKAEKTEKKK